MNLICHTFHMKDIQNTTHTRRDEPQHLNVRTTSLCGSLWWTQSILAHIAERSQTAMNNVDLEDYLQEPAQSQEHAENKQQRKQHEPAKDPPGNNVHFVHYFQPIQSHGHDRKKHVLTKAQLRFNCYSRPCM